MKIVKVFIAAYSIFFIVISGCSSDFSISQNERCIIVIPNNAGITERFAAEELRKYLAEITDNEEIDILREDESNAKAKKLIYVGRTEQSMELEEEISGKDLESFIISGQRNRLVLIGNCERATLYAVYTFLEQQGCRWLAPGIDHIPDRDDICIKAGSQIHTPGIKYRVLRYLRLNDFSEWGIKCIDWAVKNRINMVTDRELGAEFPEEIMIRGSVRGINNTHVSGKILTKELYQQHPEVFAMDLDSNTMFAHKSRQFFSESTQFCFTEENSVSVYAEKLIEYIRSHPEVELFPITQADGVSYCQCPECRKLYSKTYYYDEQDDQLFVTKAWMTFAGKVAEKVNLSFPEKKFYTLAYHFTIEPGDMDFKMGDKMVVVLTHYPSPLYEFDYFKKYTETTKKDFLDLYKRWNLIVPGGVGVYDYYPMSKFKSLPLVAIEKVSADIKSVYDLNCPYFELQSVTSPGMYLPVYYAGARTMWNPSLDIDKEMKLFYKGMYGKSAEYVEKFFKVLEKAREMYPYPYNDGVWIKSDPRYPVEDLLAYMTKEVVTEGEALLENALASSDNKETEERLQPIIDHFNYAKHIRRGRDAYSSYQSTRDEKLAEEAVYHAEEIEKLVREIENSRGIRHDLGMISSAVIKGRYGVGEELDNWLSALNK